MTSNRTTFPANASMQQDTPVHLLSPDPEVVIKSLDASYRNIVALVFAQPHTGKILSINSRAGELLGYSKEEIKHKSVFDITYVEDIKESAEKYRSLCEETIPYFTVEKRLIKKDGGILWTIVTCELVKSASGQVLHTAASVVDITDRKLAEEALRKSDENIRLIIESVKEFAIIVLDRDRRLLSWNPGAEVLFGYSEEEVKGKLSDILFTPEDVENGIPQTEVDTACREGRADDDRWLLRKDGSRVYVSGVVAPLCQQGNTTRLVKVTRDLTERINLEEMLKKANRHKTEFLAILAHELRNPLASIQSGMEVLRIEKDDNKRLITQETVERQLQQITHLVNDLLDISRIDLGKVKLNKQIIDLKDAIHLAWETARPLIEGSKHEFTMSLPEDRVIVDGDMSRLSQIFLNILINAVKYTKPGGKVRLVAARQDGQAVVRISDNGAGIPPHLITKIFEMFEQIQNREEYPQAGLGIGLSVVKQLVEMHGGHVEAYSEGNMKGSEFVVTLPLAKHQQLQPTLKESTGELINVKTGRRVLIVDDNSDAADLMEILLKKKGYKTQKAYDGRSAISTAIDFDPEVVLLDIGLPDINGHEVAKILRAKLGNRLFVALSGWGQEEDILRSKHAGFDHHIVKPVDIATIEKLLNGGDAEL